MILLSANQMTAGVAAALDIMRYVPRYAPTGRCDLLGAPEVLDTWTGETGVWLSDCGIGMTFVHGGYVDDNGRLQWRHPSDNPLQGVRF